MNRILIILAFIFWFCQMNAQEIQPPIQTVLDSLAKTSIPELNIEVDISFSNIMVKEMIRTIGNATGLNITIDPNCNYSISSNFNKVKAADVISYLCYQYNLEPIVQGAILHLQPKVIKEERLSVDLINDTIINYEAYKIKIDDFFKTFTDKTGYNFILSPELSNVLINGYAQNIGLKDALLQVSEANNLNISIKNDRLYVVSPVIDSNNSNLLDDIRKKKKKKFSLTYLNNFINAEIESESYTDILEELSYQTGFSVCLLNPVEGNISVKKKSSSLPDFMNSLFFGTENTYQIMDNSIFVGSRKLPGIKSCELIRLNNRSVDSLLQVLPQEMKRDLNIKEYPEQNSLIVWGDADIISVFNRTLEKIDLIVPVILIDVIIIDAGKFFEIETGIEAGIKDTPTATAGTINPGLEYTLGNNSVNNILSRVGLTNLGVVSPNFYMKLKAMESNGVLEIRSTPQLSTMNGHAATMSIGKTEYYKEELSNIYGTLNPQLQTQSIYKPVESKLAVNIKPFLTGNGHVSLSIDVEQSQFTERINEFAPPGLESRKFSSMIRVRDQEMILLGGLEEDAYSKDRRGWPLLSRVPILNWIFADKSEKKSKTYLNIFIKPTVIY